MNLSEREQLAGRKVAGISVVVALHVLLVFALLTGLGKVQLHIAPPEVPVVLTPDDAPVARTPDVDPPKPKFSPSPTIDVPAAPDVPVSESPMPIVPGATTDLGEGTQHGAGVGEGLGQGPVVVNAVVDFGSCPKPVYPASSLRNEEQGVTHLLFLIDTDGHIAESRVDKPSGYRMLDSAAMRALSLCKFKPGTVNGQPQKTWASVDYAWTLVQ